MKINVDKGWIEISGWVQKEECKMMNPATLLRAKQALGRFTSNHPKFVAFFRAALAGGVPEGSVIEITVTKPGQEPMTTNMRVQASDIELFKELQNLS